MQADRDDWQPNVKSQQVRYPDRGVLGRMFKRMSNAQAEQTKSFVRDLVIIVEGGAGQRRAKDQPDVTASAPNRPRMQSTNNGKRSTGATKRLPGNGSAKLIPEHGRVMGNKGPDEANFIAHEDLSDF